MIQNFQTDFSTNLENPPLHFQGDFGISTAGAMEGSLKKPKSNGKVHLLLVEDDEDDYVLIRGILSQIPDWTFRLDWAATFGQGLERAAAGRYDLCFLDYRLGERTGIELLERLQSMGFGAPVLILTGQGDRRIDLKAMSKGAADYLEKSDLSPNMVERALRYALTRARALEALRASERRLKQMSGRLLQAQRMAQ